MSNNPESMPRPPRSLRGKFDRKERPDIPSEFEADINKNQPKATTPPPQDFKNKNSNSYLDDQEKTIAEQFNDGDDWEDEEIPQNKSKVQVLNLREKRVSSEKTKKEAQETIQKEVNKVKEELEDIEEEIEETKEGLARIKNRVLRDARIIQKKLANVALKATEFLMRAPKEILTGLRFRKKKRPAQDTEDVPLSNKDKFAKIKNLPKVKYADLIAKNISFVTYDRKPMVDSSDTGIILEEIFMANALADARYCIKYVAELPTPTKGPYANRPMVDIFHNIAPHDINFFLYYVKNNPKPFVGAKYKFSEAIATWIIRKSDETFKSL